jgi:predicted MPP superfamily phosphohydrolase
VFGYVRTVVGLLTGPALMLVVGTYYLWRRLIRDTGLAGRRRTIATAALIALMASAPATVVLMRLGHDRLSTALAWLAFPWIAIAGLLIVLFLVRDFTRLLEYGVRKAAKRPVDPEPDDERRQFIARVTGGAIMTAAVGTTAIGATVALGEHRVSTVEIPIAKLPPALDGFTIAQISDLHIGLTIGRGFVDDVVDVTNAIGADLIVLTGDIVDGKVDRVRDRAEPLSRLRAPHGVFAVTGNHEYYSDADAWIPVLEALGMKFLRNQRVEIGKDGATFDLIGVDDWTGNKHPGHGFDLPTAIAGRDPSRASVVLAHQPRQVRSAAKRGMDLQLSGHTHGGQIWPWHYVARIQQGGFLSGLERVGPTWLFTSRGVGYWGPPVRVGATPEIAKIVLRAGTGDPKLG